MSGFIQPVELPKAYRLINHGPTVLVSARHGGTDNVMAAAWCCALDYAPSKLTIVLDKIARTRDLVEDSGEFVVQLPTRAQARLTYALGSTSMHDDPNKLAKTDLELFEMPGVNIPFVRGCAGWLACRVIPEPHIQTAYDLFVGEITGAWADARVFSHGRWHFDTAAPDLRTLHYVSGGQFYVTGEGIDATADGRR